MSLDSSGWSLPEQVLVDVGRLFFGAMFRLRAEGARHVPATGGALLVCNHPSYLEPALVTLLCPRAVSMISDISMWQHPPLAYLLDTFGTLGLDRQGNVLGLLRQAVQRIESGRLLALFPEGRFSPPGTVGRFESGAARIALAARCPVVPVAVCGTAQAMPRGAVLPRPVPVTVRFGPPLDLRRAHARSRSARLIEGVTREMQDAVRRLYTPVDPRLSESRGALPR